MRGKSAGDLGGRLWCRTSQPASDHEGVVMVAESGARACVTLYGAPAASADPFAGRD